MKKIFYLHIGIIIFIFLVSSCNSNSGYYLIAGEFYSDENLCDSNCEDYNADFQSAKLTVKEIDKETYLSANGINVVKDISSDRVGDYYLIELLVFSKEKEDYVQLNYNNLQRETHVHTIYYTDEKNAILSPQQIKINNNYTTKYTIRNSGYYGEFYL